jgi:hypothetical protein
MEMVLCWKLINIGQRIFHWMKSGFILLTIHSCCQMNIKILKMYVMIYLNYSNLNEETQTKLLENSKKEIQERFGDDIRNYADKNHIDFDTMLEEEAQRNLYSYDFVFII